MYTRTYYDEKQTTVPEHYSGNAIRDIQENIPYVTPHVGESKISPGITEELSEGNIEEEKTYNEESEEVGLFDAVKRRLNPKELFKSRGCLSLSKLSVEDILIIATAALLILSRDGDIAMGLMLLGLLLIG